MYLHLFFDFDKISKKLIPNDLFMLWKIWNDLWSGFWPMNCHTDGECLTKILEANDLLKTVSLSKLLFPRCPLHNGNLFDNAKILIKICEDVFLSENLAKIRYPIWPVFGFALTSSGSGSSLLGECGSGSSLENECGSGFRLYVKKLHFFQRHFKC
jgi:hypothetical protein